ncbi:MAG: nucleotidyltransferase domain-containing protein [Phycisphaerales bacterium]|nr:MAG: nucleotidyltransferase domain-containing protein [Phycisphaerales bacterium]
MIALIDDDRPAIEDLCRRYGVARLEVFGSAADGTFDAQTSDLDFLVTFAPPQEEMDAADQYFGLLFDLEALFGRRPDLVCAEAMRNPYFIRSVNAGRRVLYAA